MQELTLDFSTPVARTTDPDTAHGAAEKAAVNAGTNRARALFALVDGGPGTDFDLEDRTGIAQTSVGVRRKELVSMGLAERAPVHPRKNARGSLCAVWRATESGIAKAAELRG
jgi:hypothetical protein